MDSRGTYLAVKFQHAGKSVWETQIKWNNDFIKTRQTEQMTTSLELHVDGHYNAHVALTEASHHSDFQLPNADRTHATNLLDSINCTDPVLLAAIVAVNIDDPGMRGCGTGI